MAEGIRKRHSQDCPVRSGGRCRCRGGYRAEVYSPLDGRKIRKTFARESEAKSWRAEAKRALDRGALRALRWGAVDTAKGVIEVRESWDPKEGSIAPKTRKSRRSVPMPGVLRNLLLDRRMRQSSSPERTLVFGETEDEPFVAERLYRHADQAWRAAGISESLRLHQARHTYASFMIAAGVNPKALSAFMGHSSITVTFDLYGHLMPGTEAEGAALLDAYLESTSTVLSAERSRSR